MKNKDEGKALKETNTSNANNNTGINVDYFKSIGFVETEDGLLQKGDNPYFIELLDYQPTVGQALAIIKDGKRVYHGYYHDLVDLNKEFNFSNNG